MIDSRAKRMGTTLALLLVLTLVSCGGSGDATVTATSPTTTPEPAQTSTTIEEAPPTTTTASEPLKILVTNDDGYSAPGIDALVEALATQTDTTVTVVAPLAQQSGTGGQKTDGKLATSEVQTLSGHPATAVDGFPADSVRAAFDDLGVQPDLVIAGINSGQNLGPVVDVSGTVGAAREAVGRGVPALAVSQGAGEVFDFPAAVPFVLDWVKDHRDALLAGTAPVKVDNMNVPSCATGKIKGLVDLPAAPAGTEGSLNAQDCGTAGAGAGASNDIEAFNQGYATLTEDLRPAA